MPRITPRRVARAARNRLDDVAARRRAARLPFRVDQLACPDGRTLTVAVTMRQNGSDRVGVRIGTAGVVTRATETHADSLCFVIDLEEVAAASPDDDVWPLSVVVGDRDVAIPMAARRGQAVGDGPVHLPAQWLVVEPAADGFAHLRRARRSDGAVVEKVHSTPDGIVVRLTGERSGRIEAVSRRDGRAFDWPCTDGVCEITLTALPARGSEPAEYWDLRFATDDRTRPLIVDNADIVDYGTAVNIPTLAFRDATDGRAYYAKPYFARHRSLSIRTGPWADEGNTR